MKPKLIIFASGSKTGGGSGFENLLNASRVGVLDADIVAVVSNHEQGGVREKAERLGVPFYFFPGPYISEEYQRIVKNFGAEWVALSGWLKMVKGLDPKKTFNIHPALLSFDHGRFGGSGLYGHHVHEAVSKALEAGEISESGCTMHFVTDEYDRGPVFFEKRVMLEKGMNAEAIARLVSAAEREWQPIVTNMVLKGEIAWDGVIGHPVSVPEAYAFLPKA